MNHLKNVEALEHLIERYHAREGTYNFHYSVVRTVFMEGILAGNVNNL